MSTLRLLNKVALVTGAARGIGAAIAKAFAREGAIVWVTDRDEEAGATMAMRVRARWQYLDVRMEFQWVDALSRVVERDGRIDIVVNNAAISGLEQSCAHDPENASLHEWRAVHRTNLDGVFLGCKHALRFMRQQGRGNIINISSVSGEVGMPSAAAYASSKAGVRSLTRSVALHAAEQRLDVRCNCILPGLIKTSMPHPLLRQSARLHLANRAGEPGSLPPRMGRPEEVAAVALMLASEECRFMNGSEVTVDGGMLAGGREMAVPIGRAAD
jgi:3(or 17)beta-hydroxysteroid dehydrogenase